MLSLALKTSDVNYQNYSATSKSDREREKKHTSFLKLSTPLNQTVMGLDSV